MMEFLIRGYLNSQLNSYSLFLYVIITIYISKLHFSTVNKVLKFLETATIQKSFSNINFFIMLPNIDKFGQF